MKFKITPSIFGLSAYYVQDSLMNGNCLFDKRKGEIIRNAENAACSDTYSYDKNGTSDEIIQFLQFDYNEFYIDFWSRISNSALAYGLYRSSQITREVGFYISKEDCKCHIIKAKFVGSRNLLICHEYLKELNIEIKDDMTLREKLRGLSGDEIMIVLSELTEFNGGVVDIWDFIEQRDTAILNSCIEWCRTNDIDFEVSDEISEYVDISKIRH